MYNKTDVRTHIFLFLLNVCLFTVTGIVLHKSDTASVVRMCPALWETMALILTMKCLRMTLCAIVLRIMKGETRLGSMNPLDIALFFAFFVSECVTTSRSLNTHECVRAASEPFDGHPLIAYVNGLSAAWDGCYILSHALFVLVKRQ